MTSQQCLCIKRFLIIGIGFLSILAGLYLYLNWIDMFTEMRGKEMALSPTSPTYDGWKVSPLPLDFDVYLFNWTNPEDFYEGSPRKPRFEQLGPYRFRETPDKVDIVWHPSNYSVSFRKKATFQFDPEGSNGTLDDIVTTVDTVAHSAALRAKDANGFQKGILAMTLSSRQVTVTKTANEWLFKGYKDPLVTIGGFVAKFVKEVEVPYDRIGWLYTRNGSSTYDGHFNMFTGADDIAKMGQIYSWNYRTHNGAFPGACGRVRGSMGEFFPPNLTPKDSVWMYVPNVCRAVPLDYTETVSVHGVTAYKYSGTERSVDNGTIYPENKCFCVNNKCEASGVFSIAPCKYNSSIYMSYPHFYKADPIYLEAIEGLKPEKEKHEFFMTLEPNAGVPMDVGGGFQANYLMEPVAGIRPYHNIPRTFIPIMWAEERVRVTPEIASDIALVPLIVLIGQLITGVLFALGAIMICWYPTKFVTHLCQDPKGKNVLLKTFSRSSATTTVTSASVTTAANAAAPNRHKEQVTLLERNVGGVSLLRAQGSQTEGLLSNTSSRTSSTDVITC
ncbi:protein peste [Musca domestica]|uniref:Protein peste n=1 Tax=Musca domestica TaxID=7370 RepID=A0ABM3V219_MUSDO|nr:protein peste [Musca domestica]XP_058979820.1 protein peste [Musca domestica]